MTAVIPVPFVYNYKARKYSRLPDSTNLDSVPTQALFKISNITIDVHEKAHLPFPS